MSAAHGSPPRSAGVVIVRHMEGGWRLLMLRAYRNWDFPKGMAEAGEAPIETARREVAEETGISDLRFDWGEIYCETEPYSRGKIARYYIAETKTERVRLLVQAEIGRPEHHEWRWMTVEEALALAPPRLRPVIRWASGVVAIEGRP